LGASLNRHATLIFARLSNAIQEPDDLTEGNRDRVTVGTPLAASPFQLPAAVDRLRTGWPKLAVRIVEDPNAVPCGLAASGFTDQADQESVTKPCRTHPRWPRHRRPPSSLLKYPGGPGAGPRPAHRGKRRPSRV